MIIPPLSFQPNHERRSSNSPLVSNHPQFSMKFRSGKFAQWIAGRAEIFMFWLSVLFLACVACLVGIRYGVPTVPSAETNAVLDSAVEVVGNESSIAAKDLPNSTAPNFTVGSRNRFEMLVHSVMLVIWPVTILEAIAHWLTRPWQRGMFRYHWFSFLFCLCPALRMCARSPEMGNRMWLPWMGWRRADKRLQRQLERTLSFPMIVIAMMILPILIIGHFFSAQVAQYTWLRVLLDVGTGVIWFAFAAEFILMISAAEKKLEYCKKNWIDLAIILLPLISFLRSLSLLRGTRLAQLVRLQQFSKMARVYRLRGTIIRVIRALVLLEFAQRVFTRSPEKRLKRLRLELQELEKEARLLRRKILRLERQRDEGNEDEIE